MIQEAAPNVAHDSEPAGSPTAWTGAYRPDIDGLRAIAVLAVVVFHAGFHGLLGGFIGVDVFFVISGYLIGGQVFREAVAGEFRFSLFYTAGGYFDPASDHLPLLMSWSLGVEEQFYIVFPILVLLCLRIKPRLFMPILVAGTLVSFAGSIALTHLNPKAAFYLLPTRAWELGLGAVLALSERRACAWTVPRPVADVAAVAAVAALAAAMAL
ncbi:MAG: acyltransferase, partial [Caulobacter sp.]|nr:acyltransferase [Caulobacter sp.]